MTIRLDPQLKAKLGRLAEGTRRSRSFLAAEAVDRLGAEVSGDGEDGEILLDGVAPGQQLQVQLFEQLAVVGIQGLLVCVVQGGLLGAGLRQRRPGGCQVVEQRVVEVKQDGREHRNRGGLT